MIRPAAAITRTPIRRTLLAFLALVALGGMLLVLSSGPADADAVTFTVNKTGDANDRRINGVCDVSRKRGTSAP